MKFVLKILFIIFIVSINAIVVSDAKSLSSVYGLDEQVTVGSIIQTDLREINNGYYIFDSNGNIIKNSWQMVSKDAYRNWTEVDLLNDNFVWVFCDYDGRLVNAVSDYSIEFREYKGKTYAFNHTGQLLRGFFDASGRTIGNVNNIIDPVMFAKYVKRVYYSDVTTGELYNGWFDFRNYTTLYQDKTKCMGYFGDDYLLKISCDTDSHTYEIIDNNEYFFDQCGILVDSDPYYNDNIEIDFSNNIIEDGKVATRLDGIIPKALTKKEKNTIYFDGNNYYAFDGSGNYIRDKLVVINKGKVVSVMDPKRISYIDFTQNNSSNQKGNKFYYFNKNGKLTIKKIDIYLEDKFETFESNIDGGYNGLVNNKCYSNGILLKSHKNDYYAIAAKRAQKYKYSAEEIIDNKNFIFVDENGNILQNGVHVRDGLIYIMHNGHIFNIYCGGAEIKMTQKGIQFKGPDEDYVNKWYSINEKDVRGYTPTPFTINRTFETCNFALSDE